MKKIVSLIFCLAIITEASAQNCNCKTTFNQAKQIVEDNYAGWFDKVNQKNKQTYDTWTAKYLEQSEKIQGDSACYANLKQWISFFKDKHLTIRYAAQKTSSPTAAASSTSFEVLKSTLTEDQIKNYLTTTTTLDPIEGIYESSSYKLGVTKTKENTFYATVISTSNENWKPGEVKLIIKKTDGNYKGTFYDGNKEEASDHSVKLVDNILDFDIVCYEKTFPAPKIKQDIKEYEILKDAQAPKLNFPKKDLAVFAFPNFYGDSFEQLEYLLQKNDAKLKATPYWIIDLRDNDGGDYRVGMQLMKYIYANPIIDYNAETRMSESNYNLWYNTYVKSTYESADPKTKQQLEEIFAKMKANFGKMYNRSGKLTDTITMEGKLPMPKRIGLIINKNTVSSGELFTLLARQSEKVQVFGENSGGMIDYGNLVTYKTDCTSIRVRLPIDRYLWLNTGYSVDKEGIKPSHYLGTGNWIDKTYQKLVE